MSVVPGAVWQGGGIESVRQQDQAQLKNVTAVVIAVVVVGAAVGAIAVEVAEGGGKGNHFMHDRSRMTIDPRIPAMPGRSTSSFRRQGIHCLHQQ